MTTKEKKLKVGICPWCGHKLVYGESTTTEGTYYRRSVTCSHCKFEGAEWFDMVFVGFTNVCGEVIN